MSFFSLITSFVAQGGIFAPLAIILLSEMGVPMPFPEDILVVFVGIAAAKSRIPFLVAYLAVLSLVIIGQSFLYWISYYFGQQIVLTLGKYLHLNKQKLFHIEAQFRKYGFWFIIFGRHVPGLRDPIGVFSGMSRINYRLFLLSELLSIIFTVPFYIWFGGKYGSRAIHLIRTHPLPIAYVFVPVLILLLGFFYLKKKKKKK